MKRLLGAVAALALVVGFATTGTAQGTALKGTLMDVACSSEHATEAGYAEKHDKKCLLMDACVKSGYSLITADKKVLKFDQKGNQLALDLIKQTNKEANWAVAVNGTVSGDTIAVTNITVQ